MPIKQFCPRGHDKNIVGRQGTSCSVCKTAGAKARRMADREAYNREHYSRKWKALGMLNTDGSIFTILDYDRAYHIQQGRCKACNRHQSELGRALHADHDHATGIFRFLLCGPCNHALGLVKDNTAVLRRLADLLDRSC